MSDGGKESSYSGVVSSEAMLGRGVRKRGGEVRKKKTLKDFGGRAQKRDGAVRRGKGGRFTRFEDRENESVFPDSREITVLDREVEQGS